MANSDDRLKDFLCPELWEWCQSDDDDEEHQDTNCNLPLQVGKEFGDSEQAATACTTSAAPLLLNATATSTTDALPAPRLWFPANPTSSTSSSFSRFAPPKNDAEIANTITKKYPAQPARGHYQNSALDEGTTKNSALQLTNQIAVF